MLSFTPRHKLGPPICSIVCGFSAGLTRRGCQVGRRGLYLNDFWDHLLPWTEKKWEKSKYFVTRLALSASDFLLQMIGNTLTERSPGNMVSPSTLLSTVEP